MTAYILRLFLARKVCVCVCVCKCVQVSEHLNAL